MNDQRPVRVISLIETYLEHRGAGTPQDPHRIVRQFWTMEGEKVFEIDPVSSGLRSTEPTSLYQT